MYIDDACVYYSPIRSTIECSLCLQLAKERLQLAEEKNILVLAVRCCQQAPLDQFHQASTVRGSSSCTAPAQRSLRQQLLAIRIGSRGQTNLWLACWTDPSRDQRDICFGHLAELNEKRRKIP